MLNPHIILYIPVLDYLKPNITGITGITAMIYALNTVPGRFVLFGCPTCRTRTRAHRRDRTRAHTDDSTGCSAAAQCSTTPESKQSAV